MSDAVAQASAEALDKRFANARARLALTGYQLHILSGDECPTFLVQRWDRSRELPSLDAVNAFIKQAGGPKA